MHPTDIPPVSCAPRLAASITPGPPPVITVNPRFARLAPTPHTYPPARNGVLLVKTGGAEHRYARPNEVQRAQGAPVFAEHPPRVAKLKTPPLRPFQEQALLPGAFPPITRDRYQSAVRTHRHEPHTAAACRTCK